MSYKEFLEDIKTQDAVVRNLEIIGEAAKNISEELKKKYPRIQWKDLAGVRDKLIHHYFGVNFDIVWNKRKTAKDHFTS
ncbi:MAG: HepT-like ribonuclease domain-containing protein [bacterium]